MIDAFLWVTRPEDKQPVVPWLTLVCPLLFPRKAWSGEVSVVIIK